MSMFVTSRLVSPNVVRESQVGTSVPIDAHMCSTGRSGVAGDAERDHARAVMMDDRLHVGPRFVDCRRE